VVGVDRADDLQRMFFADGLAKCGAGGDVRHVLILPNCVKD
jgi:hypothetical protein